jgi:hypothetical protein
MARKEDYLLPMIFNKDKLMRFVHEYLVISNWRPETIIKNGA